MNFVAPLFLSWALTQNCSLSNSPVLKVPNLPSCGKDALLMGMSTVYENDIHHFGVCVCSDDQLFLGVRENVYYEFNTYDFITFISEKACSEKSNINYIFLG